MLHKSGIDVCVINIIRNESQRSREKKFYNFYENENIEIIELKEILSSNILTRIFRFIIRKIGFETLIYQNLAKQLDDQLTKNSISLLHVHGVQFYGQILSYTKFKPYIISIYGSDIFHRKKGKRIWDEYHRCFSNCEIIESSSRYAIDFTKNDFDIPESKIRVFPWGVDLNKFIPNDARKDEIYQKYKLNQDEFIIFSNRSLNEIYNWEFIIRAFALAIKTIPTLRLMMLKGNGKIKNVNNAKRIIEELNLTESIVLIDYYLELDDLIDIYSVAKCFISIPTTDNVADSLIEGISMKCFPILSNLKSYNDLFSNENATLINDPHNIKEITNAIIKTCKSQDFEAIVNKNYEFSKQLSWDKVANTQINIYKELIKGNGSSTV